MKKITFSGLLALAGLILMIGLVLHYESLSVENNPIFGVSFNPDYARELDVSPKQVYETVLGDWNFKKIRLSAQWDLVEKERGIYDFSELDYFMDRAGLHGAKVVLAVGRKTPRWPECHLPSWIDPQKDYRDELLDYIKIVTERYKNHSALEIWQVENEPFLSFGLCDKMKPADLDEEIKLVRRIDGKHPILVTDSGELSAWNKAGKAGDLFGTTLYRSVWNKYIGYFTYDWLPAWFYNLKLSLIGRDLNTAFVSELQAEPWLPGKSAVLTPLTEQYKSMNLERLQENVEFSSRVEVSRVYLWGAEWWYWLENVKGVEGFGGYVKGLRKE